MKFTE